MLEEAVHRLIELFHVEILDRLDLAGVIIFYFFGEVFHAFIPLCYSTLFHFENRGNRFEETLRGESRLGFGVFLVVIRIAAGEQNGSAAGVDARLDILLGVANHPGRSEIDVVTFLSLLQKADLRFAAFADDFELFDFAGITRIRVVGAEEKIVEISALLAQKIRHLVVDVLKFFESGLAPGDDRLVGHTDRKVVGSVDSFDGFGRIILKGKHRGFRYEIAELVDRAIAVEEDAFLLMEKVFGR
jgi:hypothetical protein